MEEAIGQKLEQFAASEILFVDWELNQLITVYHLCLQ